MGILSDVRSPVHSNPFDEPPDVAFPFEDEAYEGREALSILDTLSPEDLDWCAAESARSQPHADGLTDLAWLSDEAATVLRDGGPDPLDARALASGVLCGVVHSMRFHGVTSVAAYVDSPYTAETAEALRSLRVPVGPRRSPLAALLDGLAGWYLYEDTDAGRLAAWALIGTANEADEWGSGDADEYSVDAAAHMQAQIDAACDGFYPL